MIPSKSLFFTVFYYYPACLMYHLIYIRQLMKSNYNVGLSGPKINSRSTVAKKYPELKSLHGSYGVLMHEAQMMDGRMNLLALLTSTVEKYHKG